MVTGRCSTAATIKVVPIVTTDPEPVGAPALIALSHCDPTRRVFAFDAMMIGRNRRGGKAAGGPLVPRSRPAASRKWARREQGSDREQELIY